MATSQIVEAINSMLDKLAAIPFNWDNYLASISGGLFTATDMPDKTKLFQQLALWNNQPRQWKNGNGQPACKPNCYVEPIFGKAMKVGMGITLYPEFIWRIHIIDWQIDGFNEGGGVSGTNQQIGGLDQNLEIYEWRDKVKGQLQIFFPKHCGALTLYDERPDDEHEDLMHYIVEFKTSFSDLKGGDLDVDNANVQIIDPPQPAGQFGYQPTINIVDEIPG